MTGVVAVFSALLKSWMRSKAGIFFSFLFPIMLLFIFSTVFGGGGTSQYVLFVQNMDVDSKGNPTELSQGFVEAVRATGAFDMRSLEHDVDIKEYVKMNPSFSFRYRILVIPEGFHEQAARKKVSVQVKVTVNTLEFVGKEFAAYMSPEDVEGIQRGELALQSVLGGQGGESPQLVLWMDEQDMAAPALLGIIHGVANAFSNGLLGSEEVLALEGMPLEQRTLKVVDYFLPGFIAAFIMTNGVIGATSTISEYRRNGQVKRLAATPLPKTSWILGNVLEQTVLAFILTGVMIALGWVVFDVRLVPDAYALSLVFVGAVAFCSVGMVLGGVIKDVEAASGAGNAIAFPMMFLSGAFWPIEQMPDYLQEVARVLPLHYFHDGLLQIMVYKNPGNAGMGFVVLGCFAAVMMVIAVKITKWKEF
ncbi:MAG: ABC transporter permease [Theionarchaea archaeon]|nr:ABC transporter permease [Theionarchaea archaeon]MBU7039044.1 ABC transporter permease [Theionarchaea archaeon]